MHASHPLRSGSPRASRRFDARPSGARPDREYPKAPPRSCQRYAPPTTAHLPCLPRAPAPGRFSLGRPLLAQSASRGAVVHATLPTWAAFVPRPVVSRPGERSVAPPLTPLSCPLRLRRCVLTPAPPPRAPSPSPHTAREGHARRTNRDASPVASRPPACNRTACASTPAQSEPRRAPVALARVRMVRSLRRTAGGDGLGESPRRPRASGCRSPLRARSGAAEVGPDTMRRRSARRDEFPDTSSSSS